MRRFARFIFKIFGWKIDRNTPEGVEKAVIVVGPHTSNWDFTIAASVWMALDLTISYMMKKEAFFWPLKGFFMDIGGIPIDRSKPQNVIREAVKWFREHDDVWLGITPEGTRKKVTTWKTGFLRIAHEADVPVMLVGIDAATRSIRLDKIVRATGDHVQQAAEIQEYMIEKFRGINPANQ